MRNDNGSRKLMLGVEIEDVAAWSDPGGDFQVVITPGRASKIRVPLFIFNARMLLEPTMGDRFTPGQPENRIRPRTHPRPDLVKIQEDKEPITLRNDQKRPSIGILAFTARFLLQRR